MITFEVESADIRFGRRDNKWSCPLALALKRVCGDGFVQVGDTGIIALWNEQEQKWEEWLHTKKTERFMRRFDHFKSVHPSRFRIRRK